MTEPPLAGTWSDLSAGQTRLPLVYDAWPSVLRAPSGLSLRVEDRTGQVLEERIGDDPDPCAQYVWDARYIDAPILRWRDTTSPPEGQVDETLYFTTDANMNVTAAVDASSAGWVALRPHGHADGSEAIPPRQEEKR